MKTEIDGWIDSALERINKQEEEKKEMLTLQKLEEATKKATNEIASFNSALVKAYGVEAIDALGEVKRLPEVAESLELAESLKIASSQREVGQYISVNEGKVFGEAVSDYPSSKETYKQKKKGELYTSFLFEYRLEIDNLMPLYLKYAHDNKAYPYFTHAIIKFNGLRYFTFYIKKEDKWVPLLAILHEYDPIPIIDFFDTKFLSNSVIIFNVSNNINYDDARSYIDQHIKPKYL